MSHPQCPKSVPYLLVATCDEFESTVLKWDSAVLALPDLKGLELAYYLEQLTHWRATLKFNGPCARPVRMQLDGKVLQLTAGANTYAEFQALLATFNRFPFLVPRTGFGQGPDAAFTSTTGMNIAVISRDGQLLYVRRSAKLHRFPGMWTRALGEGLEPKDFQGGSLHEVACRILHEELAVTVAPDAVPLTTLHLSYEPCNYVWGFLGVVDFRKTWGGPTAAQLLETEKAAPDAWEHEEMQFVPLSDVFSGHALPQGSLLHPNWHEDLKALIDYELRMTTAKP
jgi:hypothetical protein